MAAPHDASAQAESINWTLIKVPSPWDAQLNGRYDDYDGYAWYRCKILVPANWQDQDLKLLVEEIDNSHEAYFNGSKIGAAGSMPPKFRNGLDEFKGPYTVPASNVQPGKLNVIAIRVYDAGGRGGFVGRTPLLANGDHAIHLNGLWEFRTGDDPEWAEPKSEAIKALFAKVGTTPEYAKTPSINRGRENPLSPQESLGHLITPDDLEVDLILAEPIIRQPLHISFDERGRMWVVEYRQYPDPAGLKRVSRDAVWRIRYDQLPPPPPHAQDSPFRGKDRISIHEDTNGDGKFDRHKVFVDGLNLATSVARGRGGVWVTNPPYLLFYPDRDNDDVPDSDPEVRLTGFMLEDTHSIANSLFWGPDGWLYATQGSTVSAAIVRPGIDQPEDAIQTMGQNVWRYHPEDRVYEVFAEGGGNAFGVEIDSKGRVYSGHNGGNTRGFHYAQGGYLRKGFNKHGDLTNPYSFGWFPHMKHDDVERFTHQFLIYEETALPVKYRGKLWGVDPLHSNVVYSEISPDGSTFKTEDLGRPLDSTDKWVRPVHITPGPDGALYIADWYDDQVNHYQNHEGAIDHDRGRIYRLRANGSSGTSRIPDLSRLPDSKLVELLHDPRRWFRQTALRILGDRKDPSLQQILWEIVREQDGQTALEAFWAVNLTTGLKEAHLLEALNHSNPQIRVWAVRLAGDTRQVTPRVALRMADLAASESHIEVRSQLACTAKRLPAKECLAIAANLLRRSEDADDPRLPLLIWWAMESKADSGREEILSWFQETALWKLPLVEQTLLKRLMQRYALAGTRMDLISCARLLALSPGPSATDTLMEGFNEAFKGREMLALPDELITELAKLSGDLSLIIGLRQNQPDAVRQALLIVENTEKDRNQRLQFIGIFGEIDQIQCVPVLLKLLRTEKDSGIRIACLGSLQRYNSQGIAKSVIEVYADLDEAGQAAARNLLSGRSAWSLELLQVIDAGRIDPDDFSLALVRKIQIHNHPDIAALTEKHWGRMLQATSAEKETEISRVKAVLDASQGVPKKGQAHFELRCLSCHTLFGKGGQIGPDLTSYQRDDIDTILLSVIAPSVEVREGFENTIVQTKDGGVHTGFLADQDNQVLVLRDLAGQSRVIQRKDVENKTVIGFSLMPEGLLTGLSDQELRDFFAYLRSTTPPF